MREKLKLLFDYQRFAENKKLSAVISETLGGTAKKLSSEDLSHVNAAGDTSYNRKRETYDGENKTNK